MGSADMMERNIDHRIEVLVSILDKDIKKQLKEILELTWKDNVKSRTLVHGHLNDYVTKPKNAESLRSQLALYNYFKSYYEKLKTNN